MQIANTPLRWTLPFAANDSAKVEVPATTSDPTRFSLALGSPPLTGQPPETGGVPPQLEDFNGAMNQISRVAWWAMGGGPWVFDNTFANSPNVNGYAQGARIPSADLLGEWVSTVDNNTINPDTVGTNWVPGSAYGATALTGQVGGSVTLTPAQAAKRLLSVAGALTSNLTIILPTWLQEWTVTNTTTGAFTVTVKTAAGSGVIIPQNSAPTRVRGDGTNITQLAENVAAGSSASQAVNYGQVRIRLSAPLTIYVSPSGVDAPNNGLTVGTPVQTINYAYGLLQKNYDLNGQTATIQLANGTYVAANLTGSIVGDLGASVTINGSATAGAVSIAATANGQSLFLLTGKAVCNVSGITITAGSFTGCQGLFTNFGCTILANNMTFGPMPGGTHVTCSGQIILTGSTITGGAATHLSVGGPGVLQVAGANTVTGSPSFTGQFALAQNLGLLVASTGTTYTGAATGTRYTVTLNAVINTLGGGTTLFPGSVAGSTSTGGQYA